MILSISRRSVMVSLAGRRVRGVAARGMQRFGDKAETPPATAPDSRLKPPKLQLSRRAGKTGGQCAAGRRARSTSPS
jgi:hypothetical protein